jgi:hypothetical protein
MFFQNTHTAIVEASDNEDPQPTLGESDGDNSDGEDQVTTDLITVQLRAINTLNSVTSIEQLRLVPIEDSRILKPLCRMTIMPIVRPTLSCDLTQLEADFVHGYREGVAVFYVSTTDEQGVVHTFSDAEKQSWNAHWELRIYVSRNSCAASRPFNI